MHSYNKVYQSVRSSPFHLILRRFSLIVYDCKRFARLIFTRLIIPSSIPCSFSRADDAAGGRLG
jgi:hypothetical protein